MDPLSTNYPWWRNCVLSDIDNASTPVW
jgi:hypothetical protein